MENKKSYMEQGLDLKRLVLVLGSELWLLLAAILLGALLGALCYKVVTHITNGEEEYRASADYYISFIDDGVDYYNAYTWDGILRDDPIVDYALTLLPKEITKETVKAGVSGEMLSDYRILTVHVNASSKEVADIISEAYQKSLWHFGQEMALLDKVELWSREEAVLFEKNNRTINAALLGSLLGFLVVGFGLLYAYVLEDAIYVERDAQERFGIPVYGLLTEKNEEQQKKILGDNLNYVFRKEETETWNGEILPTAQDYERLRKVENLLLNIPWGRNNCRQVERVLRQMELQDIVVKGIVITGAKDKFIKAYYAIGGWKLKTKDRLSK